MTEKRTGAEPTLSQDDIAELLPWFAIGRTTPAETQAIEQALSESAALRAELELVRRERHAEVESTQALGDPDPAIFEKVLSQLDGARQFKPIERDEAGRAGVLARLFGVAGGPASRVGLALRVALAVACIAIVAESIALYRATAPTAAFQTASMSGQASGPRIIVRFVPNASIGAVSAMLDDIGANIVKGPMPDGAYVIALPGSADIDAVIKQLQAKSDLVAGADRGS
jgi:hypothetical protein